MAGIYQQCLSRCTYANPYQIININIFFPKKNIYLCSQQTFILIYIQQTDIYTNDFRDPAWFDKAWGIKPSHWQHLCKWWQRINSIITIWIPATHSTNHLRVHNSNLLKIRFDVIAFLMVQSCHSFAHVMTCAKLWHDWRNIFHIRATCIVIRLDDELLGSL